MSSEWNRSKKKKNLSRKLQKVICFLLCVFAPGYFLIQILTVDLSLLQMALWAYMFINLYGNQILSIVTDTRVGSYEEGDYCVICKRQRPPGSWHCPVCEACILRRDHHCTYLAHCVGLKNYRYYVCFLGHCSLFISYTTILYCYRLSRFSITNFLNMMNFVIPAFGNDNTFIIKNNANEYFTTLYLYFMFLVYNIPILAATGTLFFKHIQNLFNGVTAYEAAVNKYPPKRHWKSNIARALGTRWCWGLLWCFADSPLPAEVDTGDN